MGAMKTLAKISISALFATIFTVLVLAFYCVQTCAFQEQYFKSIKPSLCHAFSQKNDAGVKTHCVTNITQNNTNIAHFASFSPSSDNSFVHIAQNTTTENTFAKARENCTLFLSPNVSDKSISNILFDIPEGYFVRLVDTTGSDAFKVSYGDKIGYVSPLSVKRVSFTPTVIFCPTQILTTKSGSGTQLRLLATTSSEQVALIPPSSQIEYIASAEGDKPTDGLSSEWYYVRYFPANEPTIYHEGYVYSERFESAPQISPNLEDDPTTNISTSLLPEETETPKANFPVWLKAVTISILCLPALLFAIYLFVSRVQKKTSARQI